MPVPQAKVRYPGVRDWKKANMTLSHGITPSVCTIEMVPSPGLVAEVGTLRFGFGRTVIAFPDCRVDSIFQRGRPSRWVLRIQDRRWKWQWGSISGNYNRRFPDGTLVTFDGTDRAPQQLAFLLLRAMGEQKFSIAELPNGPRPEVDWDFSNPANELARLCDSLGCRIVLGLDNVVRIERIGFGRRLPEGGVTSGGGGFDPKGTPDNLIFLGGPNVYRTKFELIPMGKEPWGTITHIDNLSYKPAGGWERESPFSFSGVEGEEERNLALQTVFRWYRISLRPHAPFLVPTAYEQGETQTDETNKIREVWQLLPLFDHQSRTFVNDDGVHEVEPPKVEGIYWQESLGYSNTELQEIAEGFTLNHEEGIVEFDRPMFELSEGDNLTTPAELYLTASHVIKNFETARVRRYVQRFPVPGPKYGTNPRLLRHEEAFLFVDTEYEKKEDEFAVKNITTNQAEMNRWALFHARAALAEYQTPQAEEREYDGIVYIQPDGAIQQVTWTLGGGPAKTRAGRNTETEPYIADYKRRRRREEQAEAVREEREEKAREFRKRARRA